MNELFRDGNKRDLEIQDLYQVLPSDNSESLGDQLGRHWDMGRQNGEANYSPSLRKAIAIQFSRKYMAIGIFAFLEECVIG